MHQKSEIHCTSIDCPERRSVCCKAKPKAFHSDEGTGYYRCSACGAEYIGGKCFAGGQTMDDLNKCCFHCFAVNNSGSTCSNDLCQCHAQKDSSQEPSAPHDEGRYIDGCPKCLQMTNHRDGACLKCSLKAVYDDGTIRKHEDWEDEFDNSIGCFEFDLNKSVQFNGIKYEKGSLIIKSFIRTLIESKQNEAMKKVLKDLYDEAPRIMKNDDSDFIRRFIRDQSIRNSINIF